MEQHNDDGVRMICEKRHDKGESDIFYPAVFCAVCRERIARAAEGNAYWDGFGDMPSDSEAFYTTRWPILFAHKRCNEAVPGVLLWMDLTRFVRHLATNLQCKEGKGEK